MKRLTLILAALLAVQPAFAETAAPQTPKTLRQRLVQCKDALVEHYKTVCCIVAAVILGYLVLKPGQNQNKANDNKKPQPPAGNNGGGQQPPRPPQPPHGHQPPHNPGGNPPQDPRSSGRNPQPQANPQNNQLNPQRPAAQPQAQPQPQPQPQAQNNAPQNPNPYENGAIAQAADQVQPHAAAAVADVVPPPPPADEPQAQAQNRLAQELERQHQAQAAELKRFSDLKAKKDAEHAAKTAAAAPQKSNLQAPANPAQYNSDLDALQQALRASVQSAAQAPAVEPGPQPAPQPQAAAQAGGQANLLPKNVDNSGSQAVAASAQAQQASTPAPKPRSLISDYILARRKAQHQKAAAAQQKNGIQAPTAVKPKSAAQNGSWASMDDAPAAHPTSVPQTASLPIPEPTPAQSSAASVPAAKPAPEKPKLKPNVTVEDISDDEDVRPPLPDSEAECLFDDMAPGQIQRPVAKQAHMHPGSFAGINIDEIDDAYQQRAWNQIRSERERKAARERDREAAAKRSKSKPAPSASASASAHSKSPSA